MQLGRQVSPEAVGQAIRKHRLNTWAPAEAPAHGQNFFLLRKTQFCSKDFSTDRIKSTQII